MHSRIIIAYLYVITVFARNHVSCALTMHLIQNNMHNLDFTMHFNCCSIFDLCSDDLEVMKKDDRMYEQFEEFCFSPDRMMDRSAIFMMQNLIIAFYMMLYMSEVLFLSTIYIL